MLQSYQFQLHKVAQAIKRFGSVVAVKLPEVDEFGEPTGESKNWSFKGLMHVYSSYQTASSSDAATTRKKTSPVLLCLWKDIEKLSVNDVILYNGKVYTVGGINNIAEDNLIGEVSLEEVQKSG